MSDFPIKPLMTALCGNTAFSFVVNGDIVFVVCIYYQTATMPVVICAKFCVSTLLMCASSAHIMPSKLTVCHYVGRFIFPYPFMVTFQKKVNNITPTNLVEGPVERTNHHN